MGYKIIEIKDSRKYFMHANNYQYGNRVFESLKPFIYKEEKLNDKERIVFLEIPEEYRRIIERLNHFYHKQVIKPLIISEDKVKLLFIKDMDNNTLRKILKEVLEHFRYEETCDGSTHMVLDRICEELEYTHKIGETIWNGHSIYLKEKGSYKKLATVKIYKEAIVGGAISCVDTYVIHI